MEELRAEVARLREAVERNNELLEKRLIQEAPRRRLLLAMLSGLMTVVGATVLVSTLIWATRPLQYFESLKPTIERLTKALEEGRR
jgi:hypothetical protein